LKRDWVQDIAASWQKLAGESLAMRQMVAAEEIAAAETAGEERR
jgi:hypothetical protein